MYVVGIGASAGGYEALDQFFREVPEQSGLSFVVVQHLDPTHKGILAELLQRSTPMKVRQVKDRMKVEPDNVYVIPPNRELSLLHGKLYLSEPTAPRGLRLPIDSFFKSLADDQHELAIGVLLSGMGSDGTHGFGAIKEKAGLTLVQEPTSAKFGAMPQSAINAGLADIVAAAGELPGRILAHLSRVSLVAKTEPPLDIKSRSALEKIIILLRTRTSQDFSLYKKGTLYRRIERRMGIHQLGRIGDYFRFLQENPSEVDLLYKELLIGVTRFFRDPDAWSLLRQETLPALLASRAPETALRAWVAGCSSGEEAYSLAILFRETVEDIYPGEPYKLQIFATDLDTEAIAKARQGIYPDTIAADVSAERLEKYFVRDGTRYCVVKAIREMIIFANHNVVSDTPFTKLDILCCRNLLIYLEPELQKKLLQLFHYSLNQNGVLFLGSAESVSGLTGLFTALHRKARLFKKKESSLSSEPPSFPGIPSQQHRVATSAHSHVPAANLESMVDKLILQRVSPAAVLVNEEGDLLYASARTGKYLEPPVGKANLNIFAMAREGLGPKLLNAFTQARREGTTATVRNSGTGDKRGTRTADVTVYPIDEPELLKGKFLIVFHDAAGQVPTRKRTGGKSGKSASENDRNKELLSELLRAREEIQTTREEMQSSQDELQSANEELQSTNEELTTSREEMQSMNEELQTLNFELSSKVEELSRQGDDMRNLLNSTDIATIFLDGRLNVRRFTERATDIVKLIETDVGRPFSDLTSLLIYPELEEDAKAVLHTLVYIEKVVSTIDARWYRTRIMPYRTIDNRIEGLVLTFVDITDAKRLEMELRRVRDETGDGE